MLGNNFPKQKLIVTTQSVTTVAGRGLQPRPKRLTDEDMAVVVENGRDGGTTPVPLGNAVKARCAVSHGQRLRIRDAARPALRSHVARGNEVYVNICGRTGFATPSETFDG